eukprot:CAMPEP_0119040628 /NCGR_PEP_ID=MMETSP1177-20130426/10632_1 /TAXON_ID=2985 /ORGANISM="Ochromonas sp, Strain CCMP1899" /LENGTH=416 /DNA_ID=CAMNT_0007005893 /DNA_START=57 /DNA_END=1304 /DNA_ORIENTATION=+
MEQPTSQLSSEDVAKGPLLMNIPMSVKFSPDGKILTYLLPDRTGIRQVMAVDLSNLALASGDVYPALNEPYKLFDPIDVMANNTNVSLEEQLRNERKRLFVTGVTTYDWCSDKKNENENEKKKDKILLPMNGSVLLYDEGIVINSERLKILYNSKDECTDVLTGSAVDPRMSPLGNTVAFVINDDLYVQHVRTSVSNHTYEEPIDDDLYRPIRLTFNGSQAGITCGLADFIAQEEMDRYEGFWWSPCGTMIAYTETDERHVPEYTILHQGKADPQHTESHRYPFSGGKNPIVKLAVIHVPSHPDIGKSGLPQKPVGYIPPDIEKQINNAVWMTLVPITEIGKVEKHSAYQGTTCYPAIDIIYPSPNDYYLARVGWFTDGSVMAQVQNRAQTMLQLVRLDPFTGKRTVLIEEKSNVW